MASDENPRKKRVIRETGVGFESSPSAPAPQAPAPSPAPEPPPPPRPRPMTSSGFNVMRASELAAAAPPQPTEVAEALGSLKRKSDKPSPLFSGETTGKPKKQKAKWTLRGDRIPTEEELVARTKLRKKVAVAAASSVAMVAVLLGVLVIVTADDVTNIVLPTNAVSCDKLTRRDDTTLVCFTPSETLTSLPPQTRSAQLRATHDAARSAGFTHVAFQDQGNVWRLDLIPAGMARTAEPAPAPPPVVAPPPPPPPPEEEEKPLVDDNGLPPLPKVPR